MHLVAQPTEIPAVYHLADWEYRTAPERMAFLRQLVEDAAQSSRVRELAVAIVSQQGFVARDYEGHARALLQWVQANIRYVNQTGEIIQDPRKTLDLGFGDCDQQVLLLAALLGAVGLPFRFVLAGHAANRTPWRRQTTVRPIRWVEGTRCPANVDWKHIYLAIGWPAFNPTTWVWADPSIERAPLGWDVFSPPTASRNFALPELGDATAATPGSPSGPGPADTGSGIAWAEVARDMFVYATTGVISAVVSSILLDAWKRRR